MVLTLEYYNSTSEEFANADNILEVLKFYQKNKQFTEKFVFLDNELVCS